jgi:glycogen debranching enzyme
MASAFGSAGEAARADDLARQAAQARRRFQDCLWMEDEGFVALGLDPDKRQIRTLASNAGECLAYGVLDENQAKRVADRVMGPDFFSGWGIRTLAASHPAYNPLGYHLGSVWPCFSALVARGLARYGFDEHLHALARALFDAAGLFEHHRLPELFGGHARGQPDARPGLYPNACWPQAWSAGSILLLVDTLVGLKPAAPLGAALVQPRLPDWLELVSLSGIRLGKGHIDLEVRREAGGEMVCEVRANTSGLRLYGPGLADASAPDLEAVRAYVASLP